MQSAMSKLKSLWKDESAQGATEYILLLAVIVGVVMFFGNDIKTALRDKLGEITGAFGNIKPEG